MSTYWTTKNVLVTGAGGFVGHALCLSLDSLGAKVTAVSHKSVSFPFSKQIRLKIADLTDISLVKTLFSGQTIIIHCAAVDGGKDFKIKYADTIFRNNILINDNLMNQLKGKKIEKFVFISSAEVYQVNDCCEKINEDDFKIYPPVTPASYYAWSKIIGEFSSLSLQKYSAIPTIIVRPANIYGPGDSIEKKRLVPYLINAIKTKQKEIILEGNGKQIRSFLYIDDYVNNLLSLIQYSSGGIYNLAGEHAISIRNFVKIFSKAAKINILFSDPRNNSHTSFVLDLSKIKKTIPCWYDSDYTERVKELL